ncbi:hypothetical protein ACWCQ1_43830 [Streptomyces sp. NPDC002144]
MEAGYLHHGVPLMDYQLTKADHRRQQEAVQLHEWVHRQLAKAPPWSEEKRERVLKLLESLPSPSRRDRQRWRLRLYCGHIIEATRDRKLSRPDEGSWDKELCPACGLDPSVIVAFEPLGSLASPSPKKLSPRKTPTDRRSNAELAAENAALRAELQALRDQA